MQMTRRCANGGVTPPPPIRLGILKDFFSLFRYSLDMIYVNCIDYHVPDDNLKFSYRVYKIFWLQKVPSGDVSFIMVSMNYQQSVSF